MPLFGLALIPQNRSDDQKLSDALRKLESDPCLRTEHDLQANETAIRGLGDLHLRVILEQLESRLTCTSIPSRRAFLSRNHQRRSGRAITGIKTDRRCRAVRRGLPEGGALAPGEGFVFVDERREAPFRAH